MLSVSSHTHMIPSLGSALGLLLPWELSCPLPESLLMAHGGRYHYAHLTGEEKDPIVEAGTQMRSEPKPLLDSQS